MFYTLNLYSTIQNEISDFFSLFYQDSNPYSEWKLSIYPKSGEYEETIYLYTKRTTNPTDFVVLLGVLIDNNNKYNIDIWLSLDNLTYINITSANIDEIIKYIYERFPY